MTETKVSLQEKIMGGLLGLLIGDALGVPYEFHEAAEIPPLPEINYIPPLNFIRAHQGVPPATWSDDGAQALCLLASLLHCQRLDLQDFANRLVNWYDYGYMAVDNVVFDVGITTGQAIAAIKKGVDPVLSGPNDNYSNGNGALMRVLPLALWHQGADSELVSAAQQQSLVTHGHLRSQICCALYCLIARCVIQGAENPWQAATIKLRQIYTAAHNLHAIEELEHFIRPDDDIPPTGSGYVVDSLRAVRYALDCNNYLDAVRNAIALGKDTDTTACIVGGMIGLRDGITTISLAWQQELRGKDIYEPLLQQLLKIRESSK